ncbi:hypothetical protein ACFSWE_09295 [Leucobacter albus]|uniref:Lipoprotein n=1 Tax=Leucobacter albus TaxID=272210 RepID=A0ABW3TQR6_9MICO
MKALARLVGATTVALLLAGCAPGEPNYSAEPIAGEKLRAGMSAEAEFYAPDGKTSGSVKATLTESDTEPGSLNAQLEFIDFASEHEQLTVGGSVDPRGDEECFSHGEAGGLMHIEADTERRVRVGGGTFNPASFDVAADIGLLPATLSPASEYGLYEIVLHDSTGCGTILAAAALDWGQ